MPFFLCLSSYFIIIIIFVIYLLLLFIFIIIIIFPNPSSQQYKMLSSIYNNMKIFLVTVSLPIHCFMFGSHINVTEHGKAILHLTQ